MPVKERLRNGIVIIFSFMHIRKRKGIVERTTYIFSTLKGAVYFIPMSNKYILKLASFLNEFSFVILFQRTKMSILVICSIYVVIGTTRYLVCYHKKCQYIFHWPFYISTQVKYYIFWIYWLFWTQSSYIMYIQKVMM